MQRREYKLWYRDAAKRWPEALPIGNGRLGGMIFGTVSQEKIQLNEDTVWYGGPKKANGSDALRHLPEVRRLLMEGKQREAEHLARMALMSAPKYLHPYQPLGDLLFYLPGHDRTPEHYDRELDLSTATARVSYVLDGARYEREYFSSAADQVLVVRLTSDRPGGLTFGAHLMRRPFDSGTHRAGNDTIVMDGECGKDGVRFAAAVKAIAEGGAVRMIGDFISVENADRVTLLVAANTTFRHADPEQASLAQVEAAALKPYEQLKREHVADYARYFDRVSFRLGPAASLLAAREQDDRPTDERLEAMQEGNEDPGLVELYFQFGRYLLLSCSRPGTLAATLQGIWNDSYTPSWESKFTININTEMNYWPAEVCHLEECHEPLFDLIERMRPSGRETARTVYGCGGFAAHHNTNLWGDTHIEGILVSASIWPLGAAWLSLHLWEHYRFGLDASFLADRAYPVMKEAAQFLLEYMIEDGQGRLLTGPSISPENKFVLPDGTRGNLCMAPAMDTQIVHTLFEACLSAASVLQTDEPFREQLQAAMAKLPPIRIGKHGQIMEWLEDYDEAEPGHRHISQLFALHPGERIHPQRTPELAQAARRTLERRLAHGGGHTGWSRAWIINFWSRLGEGDIAYENVKALLAKSTYPNLFDAHPPFQIDGNFGGTAGIAEMLLQSHGGEIALLPALPQAWPDGEVTGLRARGGYGVDIRWTGGRLDHAVLQAKRAGVCRVRAPQELRVTEDGTAVAAVYADGVLEFEVSEGRSYTLAP
ncbi:hypothetical protein PAESOLCIP111_06300 [Paenibacillus solanacearum]|uniref:Alpha-L-fucosidase n=2 Tax=Paenibacillus solanacearum TaxID=2048548 RepID=A0A916KAQ8_9BACL|nr:hypothetical protein PAESOLCIP111_06300 [Paenibacillus solanacearum]